MEMSVDGKRERKKDRIQDDIKIAGMSEWREGNQDLKRFRIRVVDPIYLRVNGREGSKMKLIVCIEYVYRKFKYLWLYYTKMTQFIRKCNKLYYLYNEIIVYACGG